ncbi:Pathogen-associated molecular patterns-induced protein A70 [Linum grandiflorum]
MKKSASTKSAFGHFEEEKIVEARRPATVREQKSNKLNEEEVGGDVGCVDAKADDFINKFKQQLKLQRLDSIIRYKEMVGRGSTK